MNSRPARAAAPAFDVPNDLGGPGASGTTSPDTLKRDPDLAFCAPPQGGSFDASSAIMVGG